MKTKLQFISRLFASALFSTFVFSSSTLFAQVKIGSNSTTIGANSNLEVEATNGNKTVISKDAGKLIVDGNAQIKTLPAAALADKSVAADANGNLTLKSNITVAPLGLLVGPTRYTSTQVNVAVNAVRSGNVVCLEGIITALEDLTANENVNEYRIALIPAGYTPRVVQQGPNGGNFGTVHASNWVKYSPIIYTNGAVGFYLPELEFKAGQNVSLNGVCYIVN